MEASTYATPVHSTASPGLRERGGCNQGDDASTSGRTGGRGKKGGKGIQAWREVPPDDPNHYSDVNREVVCWRSGGRGSGKK